MASAQGEAVADTMPDGMWVHELEEIIGERSCVLHLLSAVQRKCGPRSAARQQFLVRGTFLRAVDDYEEEDDSPEYYTYWVDKDELLATIDVDAVEEKLEERQESVLADLRAKKTARRA